jgi:hypothetical protein
MVRPATDESFRPGRRNLLIDRHGCPRYLLSPSDLPASAPTDLRAAVRLANRHRAWPQLQVFVICLVVCIAAALIFRFIIGIRINPGLWWFFVTVFSSSGGSYGGRKMVRVNALRAYELCLAHGLCPSCGYGIAGVPPDRRNEIVCPECGGAWLRIPPPAPSVDATRQTPASASSRRA